MIIDFNKIAVNRIYIDTGTFQAIWEVSGFVYGEETFVPKQSDFPPGRCPQIIKRPDGQDILESLREIFFIQERAMFDWIISPSSLREIDAFGCRHRSQYARDIMDHSTICLEENPPSEMADQMTKLLETPYFKFVSEKDRKLLIDAVQRECDVFLTIEKKLPRVANAILKKIPLLIATPMTLMNNMRPRLKGL